MADSLNDKILKWLDKEGYPLELKAAQILRNVGFEVGQSIFYQDSDTNDTREIDIVAYKYFKLDGNWITFSFVIECKSSKDKPWLAFTSKEERLYPNDLIIHRNANILGKRFLNLVKTDQDVKNLNLFKIGEETAYNLTRAFSDGIDVTYKAIMSTTKATAALVEKANRATDTYRFFFPVILIDNKLFDCHLNTNNEIDVSEIGSVNLVLSNSFDSQRANFIDIVTIEHFENKMKLYLADIEYIIENFSDEFKQ